MARLTVPQIHLSGEHPAELALDITYTRFAYGWVYYDILPSFHDQPILNDAILKRHDDDGRLRPGALHACEDEFCSLLPAMRRFIESGRPEEWMPCEPDVTLAMAIDSRTSSSRANLDDRTVQLALNIDCYQWRHVTAYGADLVRIGFGCNFARFRTFYEELRAEFVMFHRANDIRAYNIAHDFDRPEHEWF